MRWPKTAEFINAFARGLDRFRCFLKADHVDFAAAAHAAKHTDAGVLHLLSTSSQRSDMKPTQPHFARY